MSNPNPIKEDDDAVKEANLKHIAELSKEALEHEQERDQEYINHGGPWGRPLFGNIDDDDTENNKSNPKIPIEETETEDRAAELCKRKITGNDIDFLLETICKEAQFDKISVEQLLKGYFSAFTKTGIPHNLNSKDPGAGKNYLLELVAKYFPEKYVEQLVGASDKAFLHKRGKPVIKDENTGELLDADLVIEEIEDETEELVEQIQAENRKAKDDPSKNTDLIKQNQEKIKEKNRELKDIQKRIQKLINFENLIILMLDTPQEGFFANIMSLMSHDTDRNQEYLYTDRPDGKRTEAVGNIIKGSPTVFSAQTIDNSEGRRFGEINRRSIPITPNTNEDKIRAAIQLMGKKGLLEEEYDEQVVSREDQKRAAEIVEIIVEKLIAHSKLVGPRQYGIQVPFEFAIAQAMPIGVGVWAMTVMKRLMLYLVITTKIHMDERPRIVNTETGAFYPISLFEDLQPTFILMERGASNIRAYLAKAYNDAILPAYKDLNGQVKTLEGQNGSIIAQETHCGLTTEEVAKAIHERLKIPLPSIGETHKKYLKPLSVNGLINYSRSVIDRRENIWYPVDERTNAYSLFESEDLRLKITEKSYYPDAKVIEERYSSFIKQYARGGVENKNKKNIFKILDVDGTTEITVDELIEKYYQHPETCFKLENGDDPN